MLDKLLSKIESKAEAIKSERDKMNAAIINSDLIEQIVDNVIAGKETKPLFVKLFADFEEEYQDDYEEIAYAAESLAMSKVDAITIS